MHPQNTRSLNQLLSNSVTRSITQQELETALAASRAATAEAAAATERRWLALADESGAERHQAAARLRRVLELEQASGCWLDWGRMCICITVGVERGIYLSVDGSDSQAVRLLERGSTCLSHCLAPDTECNAFAGAAIRA